ncbi:MAG: hypothetical protein AAGE01_05710 [Pseudomonadota bacterium]
MTVIEINDAALKVRQREVVLADSPAFVHLGRRETLIGPDARAFIKRDPTRMEHEFWHRFGRDELRRRYKAARYQADLAFLHLEDLWQRAGRPAGPVTFALPGDFRGEQVALLLGMAARLQMDVSAVVDLAVAGLARPRPGRRLMHLDLHLHRAVLTSLSQGESLAHERSWSSPEVGLMRVLDAWADTVARLFVASARFDPMHDAEVEQRLYDQLASWGAALATADAVAISLEDQGRRFEAELGRSAIVEAAAPVYRRLGAFLAEALDENAPTTLSVTHRAGQLPGLVEALGEIPELEVVVLPESAVGVGLEELPLPDAGEDGGVPWVRSKPWLARSEHSAHASAVDGYSRRRPTHWLAAGIARPIGPSLALRADGAPAGNPGEAAVMIHAGADGAVQVEAAAGTALAVNGRPHPGELRKVNAGDRLRIDASGLDVTLIAVEHDGA